MLESLTCLTKVAKVSARRENIIASMVKIIQKAEKPNLALGFRPPPDQEASSRPKTTKYNVVTVTKTIILFTTN